jgi:isoquinoline 1-oxidoreductase beta subunit
MIIAEEMDADWSKVRVEQLPFGIVRAADGTFTWKYGEQGAGGSTNIPDAWADLRHAGARVRQVLLAAAAKRWNVPITELHTEPGIVKHADGRTISYGELAPLAATLPLPTEQPPLKDPKQWRILGTRTRVVDTEDIVTGRARYGIDSTHPRRPDRSDHALPDIRRRAENRSTPPRQRKSPASATSLHCQARSTASRSRRTWPPALLSLPTTLGPRCKANAPSRSNGRPALTPRNPPQASMRSVPNCSRAPAPEPATMATSTPHVPQPRRSSRQTYRIPFVSHSPLEPQNACVDVRKDSVFIVAPLQMPGGASRIAAQLTASIA